MVTMLDPRTKTQQGSGERGCPGCPRCQDYQASWCNQPHPKFKNLHPVCKVCGHCLLRGKHRDEGSDLDDHPGFHPGENPGIKVPSTN